MKDARIPSRPREFSEPINERLSLYALSASAAGVALLALAQPSQAEVVVTGVNVNIGHNGFYAIDLNHDGVTDFAIEDSFTGNLSVYFKNRMTVLAGHDAQILSSRDAGYAAALPSGAEIGPGSKWKAQSALLASSWGFSSGVYTFGNWFRKRDRYLGLQFQIDGETHYGWARLSFRDNSATIMRAHISGFAYETTPNQPIRAGQTENDNASAGTPESGLPASAKR